MIFTINTTREEIKLAQHLNKMLNETEANLDNNVPMSPEFLDDYISAATYLSAKYGRKGDRVNEAEMLLSEIIK